tara:strand:+ start:1340 stop:3253 length:1914 start_codon:yes stop_codon:yes gene_type:complete
MAIDFPNSPNNNDIHTSAGRSWQWDGISWKLQGTNQPYTLPTASTTQLGGVKIDGSSITINNGVISSGNVGLFGNSDIDSHLNTSTASQNEVLSWNGTDYDWVAQSGGGGGNQNLQQVTDVGKVTTNDITAAGFSSDDDIIINYDSTASNSAGDIKFKDGSDVKLTISSKFESINSGNYWINRINSDSIGSPLVMTGGKGMYNNSGAATVIGFSGGLVGDIPHLIGLDDDFGYLTELYGGGQKVFTTQYDGIQPIGALYDKDDQKGTAGQVLSSTGTALDWIDLPTAGSASTVIAGNLHTDHGAAGAASRAGATGFTDLTSATGFPDGYFQNQPTFTNNYGTNPFDDWVVRAFNGSDDDWLPVNIWDASSANHINGNQWSKITFTNPVSKTLYSDGSGSGMIKKITVGWDGDCHIGYNGISAVTNQTATGAVKEVTIFDDASNAIALETLDFWTPSSTATGKLYWIKIDVGDNNYFVSSHGGGGGNRLTYIESTVDHSSPGGMGKGEGLIMHDASLNLVLKYTDVNKVIACRTNEPRVVYLPLASTVRPGDAVTVIDVGLGEVTNSPYHNWYTSSGNAQVNPILIYPGSEDGIQGTGRTTSSASYEPWHNTPVAINTNGGMVKFVWVGVDYGWRIVP